MIFEAELVGENIVHSFLHDFNSGAFVLTISYFLQAGSECRHANSQQN